MNERDFQYALEDGDFEKADRILKRLKKKVPRTRALYLEGLLLQSTGNPKEALKKYDMALVLHLSDPEIWLAKAKVLSSLARMDMAKRAADRASRLAPEDPEAHIILADILYKMKEYEDSSDSVERALELSPKDPEALTLKGILISIMDQDFQKALSYFDSAIDSDPDCSNAWTNRGIALRQIGDRDGAVYSFQKGHMINPDDNTAKHMLEHMGANEFILKRKKGKKRKRTVFRKSCSAAEKDPMVNGRSERSLASIKDADEVVDWVEEPEDDPSLSELEEEYEVENDDPMEDEIEEFEDLEEVEENDDRFSGEGPLNSKEDKDEVELRPNKRRRKKKRDVELPNGHRRLKLKCPKCKETFHVTVKKKGITKFKCPGCGLSGQVE